MFWDERFGILPLLRHGKQGGVVDQIESLSVIASSISRLNVFKNIVESNV